MKRKVMALTVVFLACILATPVLAEQKCRIGKCSMFRSATGGNSAIIRWECSESCDCEYFPSNLICALTENGETVCGIQDLIIEARTGRVTDIEFASSNSPIKEVFVKR